MSDQTRNSNIAALESRIAALEQFLGEREKLVEAYRASSVQYRMLVEQASDVIATIDPVGRFLSLNPAGLEMLGYSREEASSLSLDDVIHSAGDEKTELEWEDLRAGKTVIQELQLVCKDGATVWVEMSAKQMSRDRYQIIVRDLTERRRLEDQLRHSQKMEAMGLLAGGMAHDFNNLLTVVTGYCASLLEEMKDEDSHYKAVVEMERASHRAVSLIRQLLAFSRRQVLQPQLVHLNRVIEDMLGMLSSLVGEGVQLEQELHPELGLVRADPGQIEQLILNLVVNARDAMNGQGCLTLTTREIELDEEQAERRGASAPGRYVQLCVVDTGCGMDEETRERVFEPFFTTKETGKGTGLGLSIVYGIVGQSDGHVRVRSAPEIGTTFEICLPYVQAAGPEPSRHAPTREQSRRGTETILLVEDEEMVRRLTATLIEKQGYRVLTAGDGVEALHVAASYEGPIHLLLTDVVMPKMGGPELVEHLTPVRTEMKVMYFSGYAADTVTQQRVVDPDAVLVAKPFQPKALTRKIRELLDEGNE
ncbi:MAG: ATP-binding protein [Proteobacteria bacterium]|nr:ATP-binding protein [Pseudomonadota bacterium]